MNTLFSSLCFVLFLFLNGVACQLLPADHLRYYGLCSDNDLAYALVAKPPACRGCSSTWYIVLVTDYVAGHGNPLQNNPQLGTQVIQLAEVPPNVVASVNDIACGPHGNGSDVQLGLPIFYLSTTHHDSSQWIQPFDAGISGSTAPTLYTGVDASIMGAHGCAPSTLQFDGSLSNLYVGCNGVGGYAYVFTGVSGTSLGAAFQISIPQRTIWGVAPKPDNSEFFLLAEDTSINQLQIYECGWNGPSIGYQPSCITYVFQSQLTPLFSQWPPKNVGRMMAQPNGDLYIPLKGNNPAQMPVMKVPWLNSPEVLTPYTVLYDPAVYTAGPPGCAYNTITYYQGNLIASESGCEALAAYRP